MRKKNDYVYLCIKRYGHKLCPNFMEWPTYERHGGIFRHCCTCSSWSNKFPLWWSKETWLPVNYPAILHWQKCHAQCYSRCITWKCTARLWCKLRLTVITPFSIRNNMRFEFYVSLNERFQSRNVIIETRHGWLFINGPNLLKLIRSETMFIVI